MPILTLPRQDFRSNQRFDCLESPGKGPIPANNVIGVDCYSVSTTPIYMPGVKGVEGNFYKINPHMVTVNGLKRGDFGVHFDANAPGSSGCVVLRTSVGWEASLERHETFINLWG